MRLGRASAYGLFALIYVSQQGDDAPVQVQQIAESTGLPIEYLRKILQRLGRARMIRSERGRRGGFRLSKDVKKITLLDVVEAIEGPVDDAAFLEDSLLKCVSGVTGRKMRAWRKDSSKKLRDLLQRTKLTDLMG